VRSGCSSHFGAVQWAVGALLAWVVAADMVMVMVIVIAREA